MCKITYYVWNKIIQGSLSRSVWKKFISLEKFYTHIVADEAYYYEVWVQAKPCHVLQLISLSVYSLVKPKILWQGSNRFVGEKRTDLLRKLKHVVGWKKRNPKLKTGFSNFPLSYPDPWIHGAHE